MPEYLTTKELAELLRIKERKVYDLAASGAVPCSRATGKLLFSRAAIDDWLAASTSGTQTAQIVKRPAIFAGSHDPLLDWALRESGGTLASNFDSSLDGLKRFAEGHACATGLHVLDPDTDTWNERAVEETDETQNAVLVHWAKRTRGLIIAPHVKTPVSGLGDIKGHTVIPRQTEAGCQILLHQLLEREEIEVSAVDWQTPARSETDAVAALTSEKADLTFGLADMAAQYRLAFVPVIEEEYALLVDRKAWFDPPFQQFLEFCHSEAFRAHAGELTGYDTTGMFDVRLNV